MTAIIGDPFPPFFCQEVIVRTFYSKKRDLIITYARNRFTRRLYFEYISLDWSQAARWHARAIERVLAFGSGIHLDALRVSD